MKPRQRLPASPMKMVAGAKLWTRKPAQAPPMATASSARSIRPEPAKTNASARPAIPATPAARPSMLSIMFSAVDSATSHRIAISVSAQTTPLTGRRSPLDTATVAMTSWAVSLVCGLNGRRSSSRPSTTQAAPPMTSPRTGGDRWPAGTRPMAAPAATARPPSIGTGRRCHRSPRGRATTPSWCASGAHSHVAAAVTSAAASAVTIRITVGDIGRPALYTRTPRSASRR